MTALDAVILATVALAAARGFRRGFVVGALALVGFAGGALLGLRLGQRLADGELATPALVALACGLAASMVLAGVGARLSGRRRPGWREAAGGGAARRSRRGLLLIDAVLGAGLSAAVALGFTWLAGAIALQPGAPRELRQAVRESLVLTRLNDALPPAAPILAVLPRFDDLPRLAGPSADVAKPPPGVPRDPDVRAAQASVARVVGIECGLRSSGSGWVAAPETVITNAHVVAGQEETQVQVGEGGDTLAAVAVAFDEDNDLAVLRVPGLDAPALAMADDAQPGSPAAMLGFPGNGSYRARSARLGDTRRMLLGGDAGDSLRPRSVLLFRATVRPGNSGGPLVDRSGAVVGTVFAARVGAASRTGFAVPNQFVRRALAGAGEPVDTGPCTGVSGSSPG